MMGKYLAFISYRHTEQDMRVSALLRRKLENWHLPKNCALPRRRRVFRDTDELPTSSDLGRDIENALEESGYLIAVCSKEYPASRWCLAEIEYFIRTGRKNRILPVLVSGTKEESFPEMIRDLPAAADLREESGNSFPAADLPEENGTVSMEAGISPRKSISLNRRVHLAIPILLSKMSGTAPGLLRRSQRIFRIAVSSVITLAAAAAITGFASYAIQTGTRLSVLNVQIAKARDDANQAAEEAVEERNTALLRQAEYLSKKAWEKMDEGDFDEAVRLALEALPEDLHGDKPVSAEALSVLRTALSMSIRLPYRLDRSFPADTEILEIRPSSQDSVLISTPEGWFEYSYKDGSRTPYTGRLSGTVDRTKPKETGGETDKIIREAYETVERLMNTAEEDGYRSYYANLAAAPNYYVFYDANLPLRCSTTYPEGGFTYMLNGKPFYADHIDVYESNFVAWQEKGEHNNGMAALFHFGEEEAVTQISLTGKPVSISWADSSAGFDYKRILIADEAGTLRIYNWRTGEQTAETEGDCTYVQSIYYEFPGYFTITKDGSAYWINGADNSIVYEIDAPAPVRELWPCQSKGYLMVLCEDGVHFYDLDTGEYVMDLETNGVPEHVRWGGQQRNGFSFDGNLIAAFYEERTDIFLPDTETNAGITDYQALFHEGTTTKSNPSYSPDGSAVYLCSASALSKWDAKTGAFLWETEEEAAPMKYLQTADGSALWQVVYERNGIRKIDAETGTTIRTVEFPVEMSSCRLPIESPDGSIGIVINGITGLYTLNLFVFSTETGQIFWQMDPKGTVAEGTAAPCFSPDSRKVYCVLDPCDPSAELLKRNYALAAYDVHSGKEISRLDLPDTDENTRISLVPEKELAVLIKKDTDGSKCWIRIISLDSMQVLSETEFSQSDEPELSLSFSGGMALSWTAENPDGDETVYCCALSEDGSTGGIFPADSYEGRLLLVTEKKHHILYGEEVYTTGTQIRRLSDGTLLLNGSVDIKDSYGEEMEDSNVFAVSPDGSSVCICYNDVVSDSLPFLVFSSDEDTLVSKAKERIGQ